MRLYINPIGNLGDFLNSIPVLSGLSKKFGKLDLCILNSMRKFKGIKEFLLYQDVFNSVNFDDEIETTEFLKINSLTREDKNSDIRPIETCRYENFLKDNYALDFDVDDEFLLKYPNLNIEVKPGFYVGDRWSRSQETDNRRRSEIFGHLQNFNFIDFNLDLLTNTYIIAKSEMPFVSTFTGVSNIADLLNKSHFVIWEDSMTNWDNKPIEYSFEKHYYKNRKGKLLYIESFERLIGTKE